MTRVLMTIPYFFLWVIYVFLTMEERTKYTMEQEKGMKCIGSKDTSWFIRGSETTYYFDPNKKPERNYITWREFWNQRGYFLKS